MYTSAYPIVSVTVDTVALTIRDDRLCVLLIRRGSEPYAGSWALPGGYVEPDETLARAAARELEEETGIRVETLEQLATYGDPGRDPRGHTVSVAHLAVLPDAQEPTGGDDASEAAWRPLDELEPDELAFDHDKVLADGVERARAKLEYTNLATSFVPEEFTVSELREVYDVIWGARLDPGNFHRKVAGSTGFVEPTGRYRKGGSGRPARTFRAGPAVALNPPLTRRSVS